MKDVMRRSVRWASLTLVTALCVGGAAAYAGAGDVSKQALATYTKFSKPIKTFVGDPRASVKPPKGKKLTIITCGSQGITCVRVANGAKSAAQALGYKATIVDGQSNPSVWNTAIRNAVASKTDGIVLAAVSPSLVKGALQEANAARIPVAATLVTSGTGVDVRVNLDRSKVAIANAAFVAKDSGGNAAVLTLTDFAEFPDLIVDRSLWPKQLKANCNGKCNVAKELQFTLALAAQRLPGDIAQALRANPKIKYIAQPFDTITPLVQQGVRQAGKTGKVKILGSSADPAAMAAIKSGDMAMALGTPAEWMGWDAVDGLVRVMSGTRLPALQKSGLTNYTVPVRYVTKRSGFNVTGWHGDFPYQSRFKKLWGTR